MIVELSLLGRLQKEEIIDGVPTFQMEEECSVFYLDLKDVIAVWDASNITGFKKYKGGKYNIFIKGIREPFLVWGDLTSFVATWRQYKLKQEQK